MRKWISIFVVAVSFTAAAIAQQERPSASGSSQPSAAKPSDKSATKPSDKKDTSDESSGNASVAKLPRDLVFDQARFWTSPLRLRSRDLPWVILAGAGTSFAIATDTATEKKVPTSTNIQKKAARASDALVVGMIGGSAVLYFYGLKKSDDHLRSTGLLAGEAVLDSYLWTTVIKYGSERSRPFEGDQRGRFFTSGSSFPSGHSVIAWSIASVVSNEYPGPMTKFLAYGTAGAVSASRIIGHQHFASDVLVGSALGWYAGYQVTHRESAREDAARYGVFVRKPEDEGVTHSKGSPYVPIDSWVYPALYKLAMLGYLDGYNLDTRPWTRHDCARMVEQLPDDSSGAFHASLGSIVAKLKREFAVEIRDDAGHHGSAVLESVYARTTGISGKPLTDGYHFAQSIVNDYGRPYQQGFNQILGASGFASYGPFISYARVEYQHSPFSPADPLNVREVTSAIDTIVRPDGNPIPVKPAIPYAQLNRAHVVEGYVGFAIGDFQLTVGKQSLWWGPSDSGPMLFSNNSDPLLVARLATVKPIKLPGILSWLGEMRTEFLYGRLSGQHFINVEGKGIYGDWYRSLDDQAWINAQKISFRPTKNFEFGFSKSGLFGGRGQPATLGTLRRSLVSTSTSFGPADPGDRRSSFDFSYRIPFIRDWLTLYADSLSEDEISPIAYPRRSAISSGIYMPKLPHLENMDFRFEGTYTDLSNLKDPGYVYWNLRYVDGYTNHGGLIANWTGREGRSLYLNSNYSFSADRSVSFSYRNQWNEPGFAGGGRQSVYNAGVVIDRRDRFDISGSVQFEQWLFPVLSPTPHHDVAITIQFAIHRPLASK